MEQRHRAPGKYFQFCEECGKRTEYICFLRGRHREAGNFECLECLEKAEQADYGNITVDLSQNKDDINDFNLIGLWFIQRIEISLPQNTSLHNQHLLKLLRIFMPIQFFGQDIEKNENTLSINQLYFYGKARNVLETLSRNPLVLSFSKPVLSE